MQKLKDKLHAPSTAELVILLLSIAVYVVGVVGIVAGSNNFIYLMLLGILGFFGLWMYSAAMYWRSTQDLLEAQADLIKIFQKAIDEGKLVWTDKREVK